MASSLSNLDDNLAEGIHKINCKDFDCFLEYERVRDNLIKHKCLSCNKDNSGNLDEESKKIFKNTFKFFNNDINKFILLLRKFVYPYEYMDELEKFNETSLPEKEEFYNNLKMRDITDADYMHEKRVCKDFEIKYLGYCHDLYFKGHKLLLANVFENFRKMYLEVHQLDTAKFLSAPGLAWEEALKKTEVKLKKELEVEYVNLLIDMQQLIYERHER